MALLVFGGLLVGCAPAAVFDSNPATPLAIYLTPTSAELPTAFPLEAVAFPTTGPTATPFTYAVREGDTLLGIAYRFGLEVEDMIAANPGVEPYALRIGQSLVVPVLGDPGAPLPLPTPIPLELSPVNCYPSLSRTLSCLLEVANPSGVDLEGLLVSIYLVRPDGSVVSEVQRGSYINRLPAGGKLPLAARFDNTGEDGLMAVARLVNALPVGGRADHYLDVQVERTRLESSDEGRSWELQGRISLPGGEQGADRLLLIASGYDARGRLAGLAVWERVDGLEPGQSAEFGIKLFSLGPAIVSIELVAEAMLLD